MRHATLLITFVSHALRVQRSFVRLRRGLVVLGCAGVLALMCPDPAAADESAEHRLKLAFVYNFLLFTEWQPDAEPGLTLCIQGQDSFGAEIDALAGKVVAGRPLSIRRRIADEALRTCHVVFIATSAAPSLPRTLERLKGRPILTIGDSEGLARQGVMLNLIVLQNRVVFEANLLAARAAGVRLSSRLLKLAHEVIQ